MTTSTLTLALFVYTVAAFGLAWILGHAKVSLGVRVWLHGRNKFGAFLVELVECPGCLGVWLGGLIWGLASWWFTSPLHPFLFSLLCSLLGSCYTAGANIVLAAWTRLIDLSDPKVE